MLNNNRWVLKKHTNNIAKLIDVAMYLKANKSGISTDELEILYKKFTEKLKYNPRKSVRDKPLDAINHKISELNYYMFGYSDKINGNNKFIFSPLGNLFLKYLNDSKKTQKIFATMLFSIQFPHPASKPSEEFMLFPFRLIFKLLLDERLEGKIYNYEIYQFIIYIDRISEDIYENLVNQILNSRKISDDEKLNNLKNKQYEFIPTVYAWQYYVVRLLSDTQIIINDAGNKTIELYHPQKPNSKSAPTKRIVNNGFFKIHSDLINFIHILLKEYSFLEEPLRLDDAERKSSDVIKEIYSFYPDLLLHEIGEEIDEVQTRLLRLPKLIEEYSNNPNNETSDYFEDILEEAFNMFYNVEATKLSGAGRTDIECIYLTAKQTFAVEAKSTANKLLNINAGRLKRHRQLINASYTIVVTPRYVPSVRYDIKDQDIVIIKANTLSEYLYNYIISNNREIDYGEIQNVVKDNLGKDISMEVSELTLTRFG